MDLVRGESSESRQNLLPGFFITYPSETCALCHCFLVYMSQNQPYHQRFPLPPLSCVDDPLSPEHPVSEHFRLLKRIDLRCVIKFCLFCVFEPFYYFRTKSRQKISIMSSRTLLVPHRRTEADTIYVFRLVISISHLGHDYA